MKKKNFCLFKTYYVVAHFHYVLSMGAVFALFSAWYYWSPKIFGLSYNELAGQIHFWILFIGVNVTFLPLHFLGLQGMPRRIPDYPDAFAGWNLVASYGSIMSVIAVAVFIYVIYDQLVNGKAVSNNPWRIPAFFESTAEFNLNANIASSLEWSLQSPPAHHAYNMLPAETVQG